MKRLSVQEINAIVAAFWLPTILLNAAQGGRWKKLTAILIIETIGIVVGGFTLYRLAMLGAAS